MNPRTQQRGEARRARILAVANKLFRQQGYAATSMRQIAEEAGFGSAVSGLYNHFPSKQAIFEALLEVESPYEALQAAFEEVDGATLHDFIRNLIETFWGVVSERFEFLQLAFIDLQEFEGKTLASFSAQVIPSLFMTIVRLKRFPEVRDDIPLAVIARTLASAMIGFTFTEYFAQRIPAEVFPLPAAQGEPWMQGIVSILARGISKMEES